MVLNSYEFNLIAIFKQTFFLIYSLSVFDIYRNKFNSLFDITWPKFHVLVIFLCNLFTVSSVKSI